MITASRFNYALDKVNGQYRPGRYPGNRDIEQWSIPDDIRNEYARLNSIIETKYTREYLKICAFYNKLFPSLRTSAYISTSYNTPPFTTMDQERDDTGTGISSNFLKQIVDQVVSRIGTTTFEPALVADEPTLEYIIYKEEVERLMRKEIRSRKLAQMCMAVFHDAAIVGYSHVIIDPVLHIPFKAEDYEVGMFESQYSHNEVTQMLYRNYNFPVTGLVPYIKDMDPVARDELIEELGARDFCDFKMFFDCPGKRVVITIAGKTIDDVSYPFDTVQMVTFGWDIGFAKVTSTSLFDLLYPNQREINKLNAKLQQIIRMYKGPVPVFSNDVDLAMKQITNGAGEALYVDSNRAMTDMMTVINPTPLDPQIPATKTEIKTEMYELAGLQQTQFDMENFRSAAAFIAADQFHDTVFQAQLSGMATFVNDLFKTQVHYNAVVRDNENPAVKWSDVDKLLNDARMDLKPIVMTTPMGNKAEATVEEPDYVMMAVARTVKDVIRNTIKWDTMSPVVDRDKVKLMIAVTVVKMQALNITIPDSVWQFLIMAFIDDMKQGRVTI